MTIRFNFYSKFSNFGPTFFAVRKLSNLTVVTCEPAKNGDPVEWFVDVPKDKLVEFSELDFPCICYPQHYLKYLFYLYLNKFKQRKRRNEY